MVTSVDASAEDPCVETLPIGDVIYRTHKIRSYNHAPTPYDESEPSHVSSSILDPIRDYIQSLCYTLHPLIFTGLPDSPINCDGTRHHAIHTQPWAPLLRHLQSNGSNATVLSDRILSNTVAGLAAGYNCCTWQNHLPPLRTQSSFCPARSAARELILVHMAAPGGQPQWQEDKQRSAWYYVDPRDGARIYQNGVRVPRNPQPSAPRVLAQPAPSQVPQPQTQLSTSPSANTPGYTLSNAASRAGQQSPQSGQRMLASDMAGLQVGSRPNQPSQQIGGPSTPDFRPRNPQPQPQLPGPTRPTITQENGVQIVVTQEPRSRVVSKVGVGPAHLVTDPTLYSEGRRARGALYGTDGEEEQLFSTFRIRRHSFYIRGRVFRVLWAEPAGEGSTDIESFVQGDQEVPDENAGFTQGRHGQSVYSKARRFVVIREGDYYCSVLPITSYGKQGVGKQGVKKSEHSIIYSHKPVSQPMPSERPDRGEAGMRTHAIQVTPDIATEKLDPFSRLDYGKIYTVHHNLKVESYGVVHPNSMDFLLSQWEEVFLDSMRAAHPSPNVSSSNAPASHSRSTDATRTSQQPRVDRPPPNVAASATQSTVSGTPGQSTAQAPLNSSEIARVRQAIQASMQQGRTQAEAVSMLMQRYQAAGHSIQRATSVIQAACQAPESAGSSSRDRSDDTSSGPRDSRRGN
ncbi:hypothetical protein LTR10_010621 [Elasticomyces elasticus]|nr:hypothetical protein LTR10_010621 [Elasticomyces elasticus]KAK4968227.1 hypothetical protein LTR42_009510 [Elasticomyces elasticus]